MKRALDMTRGNPARLMGRFALPMMAGYALQQLYTIADSAVIGRLIGVEAFAAVGASSWLNWMVTSVILGLTQGFAVPLAQRFGAGDVNGLRRTLAMSALWCFAFAALLTPACMLAARPLLRLLKTPEQILEGAWVYLEFMFAGIGVALLYNLAANALRALGDSVTPVRAMVASSLINVALDVLFVAWFHWGIPGVALGTLVAQLAACGYCIRALLRLPAARLSRADWRIHRAALKELIRMGGPLALRNGVTAVGGLAVQYVINGYGVVYVAGMTAAKKLYGIMELIGAALDGALATYVAQNFGARQYGRVREGVRLAVWMALASSIAIGALLIGFGRGLLSLFVVESAPEVLEAGYRCLVIMSASLPALYLLFMYRSALQGIGNALIPTLSGVVELALRVAAVAVLPHLWEQTGVYLAESAGWVGAMVLLAVSYACAQRRLPRKDEPRAKGEAVSA